MENLIIHGKRTGFPENVYPASRQQLNGLLLDECRRNCFKFVDYGVV